LPCPQHGRKRESSGESGQKQGSSIEFDETCRHFVREIFLQSVRRVSGRPIDVIEPAGTESVVAMPTPGAAIPARPDVLITIS
jgi:hypothetical protein